MIILGLMVEDLKNLVKIHFENEFVETNKCREKTFEKEMVLLILEKYKVYCIKIYI